MSSCADCVYMDLNDRDSDGWCFCGNRGSYYPPSDSTCWSFKERESGGGCYLTTLTCNILGYSDNGSILNTMRRFRDDVMSKSSKYKELLEEYDLLGPKLVMCIEADSKKQALAMQMKSMYILPVYESLKRKDYEKAVAEYKEMVLYLKKHYKEQLAAMG